MNKEEENMKENVTVDSRLIIICVIVFMTVLFITILSNLDYDWFSRERISDERFIYFKNIGLCIILFLGIIGNIILAVKITNKRLNKKK